MNDWEKIVLVIISVNQWRIEKSLKMVEELRKEGLMDFSHISKYDLIQIGNKLKKVGYDRGSLTYMISERIFQTIQVIQKSAYDVSKDYLKNNVEAETFLLSLPGIGPKAVSNFYLLSL